MVDETSDATFKPLQEAERHDGRYRKRVAHEIEERKGGRYLGRKGRKVYHRSSKYIYMSSDIWRLD